MTTQEAQKRAKRRRQAIRRAESERNTAAMRERWQKQGYAALLRRIAQTGKVSP